MAIRAKCGGCGKSFSAKDSLAGKKVKCPQCANPILIPNAAAKPATVGSSTGHNPMLDLLDEAKVKSAVSGPTCPNCDEEMAPTAIVCISCGYNVESGKQLTTAIYDDDDGTGVSDVGVTDADRIMAQAEKDIEDMPVTAVGQDFGDGADSFLIAGIAGVILLVLVGIGLTVIFTMDVISQHYASWFISFLASCFMILAMGTWITIVAFMQKPIHGILCICTAGFWCIVFGFMQGKALLMPTIIILMSFVVGAAAGAYTLANGITPSQ